MKTGMIVQENSEAVLKARRYGEVLENIEQIDYATIEAEDSNLDRITMVVIVEGHEYQLEVCQNVEASSVFPEALNVVLADSEQYYGLLLLDKTIEAFRSIGVQFNLEQETRDAIDLWHSFRETTPIVDRDLQKVLFPGNYLRVLTMLGLVEKREKDVVFL